MADYQKIRIKINYLAGTEKNDVLDVLHMLTDAIQEIEYKQFKDKK